MTYLGPNSQARMMAATTAPSMIGSKFMLDQSQFSARAFFLGGRQSRFNRPSGIQSRADGLKINADFIGPIFQYLGAAKSRKAHVCAAVPCLGLNSRPSTIVRGIRAIVVDAINRMLRRWAFAHVGQKILKTRPPLANGNPPAAVPGESNIVRIKAALTNASPNLVFGERGIRDSASFSIGVFQTTARRCVAGSQVAICDVGGSPAITRAFPQRSLRAYQPSYGNQSAKAV